MTTSLTYRDRVKRFIYFFPFQLLLLHFKKNHLLLLCWLVLFGYVLQALSANYGVPYLILAPEYFGTIGFVSFFITGMALGGFITAFNLYSYALHAFRFPFIATVARPFAKFSINNGIIPIVFLVTYIYHSIDVQVNHELFTFSSALLNIVGFLCGVSAFIALSYLYFTRTNTDIIKILGSNVTPPSEPSKKTDLKGASKWFKTKRPERDWHIETYLAKPYRIALARKSDHYDNEMLGRILWQNHINGSLFEILLVLSFLSLGAFSDIALFTIPAGASIFMLFTTFLMVIAAIFSWFKGWTLTVLIGVFLIANQLSVHYKDLFYQSQAYGLNYDAERPLYNAETIKNLSNDSLRHVNDREATLSILEKWKVKNVEKVLTTGKPKMALIAVSGGGSRSMLWTYRSLQYADSILHGQLLDKTMLMTGSSGGLIGASYFRQLYNLEKNGLDVNRQSRAHLNAVSKDILNHVGFALVTNDLFVRYRKIKDGEKQYTRDRGFAFEKGLNTNLNNVLDLRMRDMTEPERNAEIPLLLISPTCINDGRRLLISAQPMSYMAINEFDPGSLDKPFSGTIEFNTLFAKNDPLDLKITSALRMSATFPYIMPVVTLPSKPGMQMMDSGVRDNYGISMTLKFIHEFRDWIEANTSGVVIIQIRDRHKDRQVAENGGSLLQRFTRPIQNVTGNMLRVQDMEQDEIFQQACSWADFPIERVPIELRHDHQENISLSWHLTASEKEKILQQIYSPSNAERFERISELFDTNHLPQLLTEDYDDTPVILPLGQQQ